MSGIYIHIPFCKSKCYYCDFYSVTTGTGLEDFIQLLHKEILYRKDYLPNNKVDTIYFGGGTPTQLHSDQLEKVLIIINELFEVDRSAEITIEANPDDLDMEVLGKYKSIGFNRISAGTQSFADEHLKLMHRRHDSVQAFKSVEMAYASGFDNISIDLIYGIPGMTAVQWQSNLTIATGLPVNHISAYHLSIEPGTRFGRLKKAGLFSEVSDDESVEQYQMLTAILSSNGFEHYEISNFARHGWYSRHNTKYWTGESYLGLGPAAHSFNGTKRHWNPAGIREYTADIINHKAPGGENIDPLMRRNEYVMTRLRTSNGIHSGDFTARFGEADWTLLLGMAGRYLKRGDLILKDDRLIFDEQAWFHSDGVLSDLFLI